ncbi:hypothetical protein H0H92_011644 [Tricholoma furcatifolium]|nr:hypothetical protein H0H92_011644 [Tricholoma furcatifolium]
MPSTDAKRVDRFFTDVLDVPKDQICLLLDRKATKQAIEDSFMNHLTNNPAIDRGDAIVVYFAGHGSTIPAPKEWFEGHKYPSHRNVEVLCPFDHDTKHGNGRIAGISDRSIHALLDELARVKGDNITFIADCCFSPSKSLVDRCRSSTRWTPTTKAKPDDLYSGLWPEARGKLWPRYRGFYTPQSDSHVLLAACQSGGLAIEDKGGGRFTDSFLAAAAELSLHRTSYESLMDRVRQKIELDQQSPICIGVNKSRIVFNTVPFVIDSRFMQVNFSDDNKPRISAGVAHGITEGSEFSLHIHNYRTSCNPVIGTVVATEVHPTWCFGRLKFPVKDPPKRCWAQVTRWNNRHPFRVHLKKSLVSFCKFWKLSQTIPTSTSGTVSKGGLNIIRVKNPIHAHVSVQIGSHTVTVERKDEEGGENVGQAVRIAGQDATDVIDDAARFDLHLYRRNPEAPLNGLVNMELFRLNPNSWTTVGENLLKDGKASISYEKEAIFSVIINNSSDIDLWPYLFYMDPVSFSITNIYDPGWSHGTSPPILRRSQFSIGSGHPGSEALSFSLSDATRSYSGYIKLFLSDTQVSFGIIEQGRHQECCPATDLDTTPESVGRIWDAFCGYLKFS